MPCRDGGGESVDDGGATQTELTQMLCWLMRKIERGPVSMNVAMGHPRIPSWWSKHKKHDAEQAAYEKEQADIVAAKKTAIKKLSAKERRLLGFNEE